MVVIKAKREMIAMIKNESNTFQINIQPPETVEEAVDRLMIILDGEQKIAIASMQENDLIDLHFTLGMAIRNGFGLHNADNKLIASVNKCHPDDACEMIVKALWHKLVDTKD